jgi:N-acetylmuramoyl-L-alanine amidase
MVMAMPVPGIRGPSVRTKALWAGDFPSPNCGPRRGGVLPDLIVLHFTAMASTAESLARLCDPQAEVSCHYLIAPEGTVLPLVPEELRAWHAGGGAWGACSDVNSRSIGIELQNDGRSPFGFAQMQALVALLADIRHRWAIPAERIIGHSDMAPLRKADPGARFDWQGLALAGQSIWPEPSAEPAADFRAAARAFGYPDLEEATLLAAFRLRFRPWASGPLEATDRALIADLAARFPVDAGARWA